MTNSSFERERIAEQKKMGPEPGTDPVDRLRHVVKVYEDEKDEGWIIVASHNIYGRYEDRITTGLTHGDARALLALIESKKE